jgi:F0F1-type ATP synthase assembly protein I
MADNKDNQRPWSALGFAWELGYSIVIPLVVFALAGRLLDKKLGTSPWLLLVGLLLAIVSSSYIVYKKTIKIMK